MTKEEEIVQLKEQLEQSATLLKHFLRGYSSAYTLNLKDDTFEILHMNHEFQKVFTMNGNREDMMKFIDVHIHPDDREKLKQIVRFGYLAEQLKTQDEITFTMREIYDDEERTMQVLVVKGCDEYHASIGFMDVTESLKKERLERQKLELANKSIGMFKKAMQSHALISLTVDLTTNTLESGIWVDDDGIQVELEDILGLSCPCNYDDYITLWRKKFVSTFSNDDFQQKTDRNSLLELYKNGENEISFDYVAQTISNNRQNLRRTISLIIDPDSGHLIAYTTVKNVTQEKRNAETLHTQTRIINRLAERYTDIYLVNIETHSVTPMRIEGKGINVDESVALSTPYSVLIEKYINENVVPEDRKEMLKATQLNNIKKIINENIDFFHHFRALGDGNKTHYFYMQASRIGHANEFNQMVIGFSNEDEDKEKELLLKQALIAAKNSDQAKTSFLFNMSHDIRTPMNAIIGFTDIAMNHIDDKDRVVDSLQKVKTSSTHLLSLINDVLDMSRVQSGKVEIEEKPLNIDILVDNLSSMVAGTAYEKNLDFSCKVDGSIKHHWLSIDRLRMMRILTNVISNSIKYTKNGYVKVTVSEENCKKVGYATIVYTIEDTGIGMSPEFVKEIFEPFAREKTSTESGVIGTGLGMAITKSLIDLMKGKINVKSAIGEGTTVKITISYKIAKPQVLDADESAKHHEELKGKRVLLVEDNELNRELATVVLEESGLIVDAAEDGDVAVEKIAKSPSYAYDVVLMDIQMPKMNGYEATKTIRKMIDLEKASIPIIAMTANAFEEDKKNAFNAGMNAHIAKPLNVENLLATLEKVLIKK